MSGRLRRYAIIVLVVNIILLATLPVAETELEIRRELRAGDLLFNEETILAPFHLIDIPQPNVSGNRYGSLRHVPASRHR